VTSSRSARRARRDERRRRAGPVPPLRTADWDATTIEFTGASGAGLPGPATEVIGRAEYSGTTVEWHSGLPDGVTPVAIKQHGRDTQPIAQLRAEPRYQPPDTVPAGYAATTGPIPALGRPAVSIGDALTRDETWGPKLAPLPCGHCGAPPPVPAGILERTRIIGHVNWLAARAGWRFDTDLIRTCPACQQDDAWKARQGQLELRLDGPPDAKVPPSGTCDRHDAPPWADVDPDECRCTCPGAVLAVDVMLASEDHLGSGRGRHKAGA
jgi:hypothetical protein